MRVISLSRVAILLTALALPRAAAAHHGLGLDDR